MLACWCMEEVGNEEEEIIPQAERVGAAECSTLHPEGL